MELLDEYFDKKKAVHDYFGYKPDWVEIPLEDGTEYYWYLEGEGMGDSVLFAESIADLNDVGAGNYYSNEIYTQRFLPKWVYRGKDYTMVCVDTHTDGNKFLQVFDNSKEVKEISNGECY